MAKIVKLSSVIDAKKFAEKVANKLVSDYHFRAGEAVDAVKGAEDELLDFYRGATLPEDAPISIGVIEQVGIAAQSVAEDVGEIYADNYKSFIAEMLSTAERRKIDRAKLTQLMTQGQTVLYKLFQRGYDGEDALKILLANAGDF